VPYRHLYGRDIAFKIAEVRRSYRKLKEWLAPALEPSVFDYNMAKIERKPFF